jgi:hypothetical protein
MAKQRKTKLLYRFTNKEDFIAFINNAYIKAEVISCEKIEITPSNLFNDYLVIYKPCNDDCECVIYATHTRNTAKYCAILEGMN